jgi:hypothetical protein
MLRNRNQQNMRFWGSAVASQKKWETNDVINPFALEDWHFCPYSNSECSEWAPLTPRFQNHTIFTSPRNLIRLEVKISISWDGMTHSLVEYYTFYEKTCHLSFQGVFWRRKKQTLESFHQTQNRIHQSSQSFRWWRFLYPSTQRPYRRLIYYYYIATCFGRKTITRQKIYY